MSKTAIVLEATGLTGGMLTELLIKDPSFSKIKLFTRRSTTFKDAKVQEIICDLLEVDTFKTEFTGDVVFCCVGTTKAKTPDKEKYKAIDYGIPIETATLAKENGIPSYMVISSVGTSENSPFFYVRTKGEMERDLLKIGIDNTFILKPAFIDGPREEDRKGEDFMKAVMSVLDFMFVGPLKKYKSTKAIAIARALAQLAVQPVAHTVINNVELKELSASYKNSSRSKEM